VPETYTGFLTADGLRGKRLGVIRDPLANDTNPDAEDYKRVRPLIEAAIRDLAASGAEIVDPVVIPGLLETLERTNGTFETESAMNQYLAEIPDAPAKTLQELLLSSDVLPSRKVRLMEAVGHTTDDPGYLRHMLAREELRTMVLKAMADNRLDALVYSTFDSEPNVIPDDIMTRSVVSNIGNNRRLAPMVGYPALTVPAGFTSIGLPVGLELLGRPFSEGTLFAIGYGYEQATHHRRPPETTPALAGEP